MAPTRSGADTSPVTSASRADWRPAASTALLRTLKQEKDLGRMAENGFKATSWQAVTSAVLAAVQLAVTIKQCKAHWQTVSTCNPT